MSVPPEFTRENNAELMRYAIELAKRASGNTHPNPIVGALILENGKIVAEGWHARAGTPHAERVALANLQRRPLPGASLLVTLEPCSTHGRTGACTEAILSAGISRVVVGAIDPNPAHAGRGIALLKNAGVEVVSGVLEEECRQINPIFNYTITTGKPLFAAKIAMDARGRTFEILGKPAQITGTLARQRVMEHRRYYPAIATGAGTVLADNCALTIRGNFETACPIRFVFDRSGRTLDHADTLQIFNDSFACSKTIFVTHTQTASRARKVLRSRIADIWEFPVFDSKAFFQHFRERCQKEGIIGVYFEAGERLLSALIRSGEANYLYAFIAQKEIGGNAQYANAQEALKKLCGNAPFQELSRETLGDDFLIEASL